MPDEAELSAKFIAVFFKSGFIKIYRFLRFFKCINSRIVRQKNNKDRERQAITEIVFFLNKRKVSNKILLVMFVCVISPEE